MKKKYLLLLILILFGNIYAADFEFTEVAFGKEYSIAGGIIKDTDLIFYSEWYSASKNLSYEKVYLYDTKTKKRKLFCDSIDLIKNKNFEEDEVACWINYIYVIDEEFLIIVTYYDLDISWYKSLKCIVDMDGNIISIEDIDRDVMLYHQYQCSKDNIFISFLSSFEELRTYDTNTKTINLFPFEDIYFNSFVNVPNTSLVKGYRSIWIKGYFQEYTFDIEKGIFLGREEPLVPDYLDPILTQYGLVDSHLIPCLNGYLINSFTGIYFYDIGKDEVNKIYEFDYSKDYSQSGIIDIEGDKIFIIYSYRKNYKDFEKLILIEASNYETR